MQESANCKPHLHDYLDKIQMYKKNKFNWRVDDLKFREGFNIHQFIMPLKYFELSLTCSKSRESV